MTSPGPSRWDRLTGDQAPASLDEWAVALTERVRGSCEGPEVRSELDRLAATVARADPDGVLEAVLNAGFTGDAASYHDPANTWIDDVLRRRRGIPISLGLVVVETARRAGVGLSLIGMPGHVLVGTDDGRYVDAFAGRFLDGEGARSIFESLHDGAQFHPSYLAPISNLVVARRMLNNLRNAAQQMGDLALLESVLAAMATLPDCDGEALTRLRALRARLN